MGLCSFRMVQNTAGLYLQSQTLTARTNYRSWVQYGVATAALTPYPKSMHGSPTELQSLSMVESAEATMQKRVPSPCRWARPSTAEIPKEMPVMQYAADPSNDLADARCCTSPQSLSKPPMCSPCEGSCFLCMKRCQMPNWLEKGTGR